MTKAQVLALMNALESQQVTASANMVFPSTGGESWSVSLPETHPLTGAQLGQLSSYCAANGLTLSATFSYLGIT